MKHQFRLAFLEIISKTYTFYGQIVFKKPQTQKHWFKVLLFINTK